MSFGDNSDDKSSVGVITYEMILCMVGEFDIESIHDLKLVDRGIEDLSPLEECKGLERLNLSRNNVSVIKPLAAIKTLVYLNLSSNRLSNVDALGQLENLKELNLAGNLLCGFERLHTLKMLSHLEKLRLRDIVNKLSNPLCSDGNYTPNVLKMFPMLYVFDGDRVRGRGKELFEICREIDDQLKSSGGHELLCPCDQCQMEDDDKRTFGPVGQRPLPGRWLPNDFFDISSEPRHNIPEKIEDATKVLKEVKDLDIKAQKIIQSMRDDRGKKK